MKFLKLSSKDKKIILGIIFCYIILGLLDIVLAAGAALVVFLTAITFLILQKIGFKNKTIYILFLISFLIHLAAILFVYYANFQPFSGGAGDFSTYDYLGREISQRLNQGNFSLQGLAFENHYSIIIGYIYALLMPEMLIGQMLNAWIIALLAIFVYLIVLEMKGSEKQGFLSGLIVSIYPSLLFFGSLLGKDAWVALLSTITLFLILKLIRSFSWKQFLIFYIILAALMNLRIYIGCAVLFTFIVCWPIFSNLNLKKRLIYVFIMIVALGFLPQVSAGQGYYGVNFFREFLSRKTITYYRELIAIPNPKISPITGFPIYDEPSATESSIVEEPPVIEEPSVAEEQPATKRGRGSAVMVETGFENPFIFLKNSFISFIYASIGPFPWQLRYLRHLFILPEIIILYFSLFFIIKGIKKPLKSHTITLLFFSLISLAGLSIFIANFGITTRIRIPAFISLFCLVPFGINWFSNNKIIKILSKSLDALMKI